jgi:hypothetical protein
VLAEHAPIGLVLQSWMEIEGAMADAAVRHGFADQTKSGSSRSMPSYRLIDDLDARHVITKATAQTLRYLRQLRNQVAHHKGVIDTAQALEYARLAKKVVDALNEEPGEIPGVVVNR